MAKKMSKKVMLSGYSEQWDGTKWVRYNPTWPMSIPALPGCYVVYVDGKPVYVGQSKDVRKRIQGHGFRDSLGGSIFTPWGYFKECYIKVRFASKYGDWAMRELRLIHRLQPAFNCVGSTKRRKING